MNNIKIFICKRHNLKTTRKGMREHLAKEHARNRFKDSEIDSKGNGTWSREDFQ